MEDYPAATELVGQCARRVFVLETEVFEVIHHMDMVRIDPEHHKQCPPGCLHTQYAVALWSIVDACTMLKKHPRLSSQHFTCTVGDVAAVNAFVSRTRTAIHSLNEVVA